MLAFLRALFETGGVAPRAALEPWGNGARLHAAATGDGDHVKGYISDRGNVQCSGSYMNAQSSAGLTVLVVEDEPLVLDMIAQELTDHGFAVVEADTAEAALSIIDSGQDIDVLFTDIRLPGEMDGWRLAAAVREAKPQLPVIYATGYTVERAAQVPGSVFLKKPYRPSAIVDTIRSLMGPAA